MREGKLQLLLHGLERNTPYMENHEVITEQKRWRQRQAYRDERDNAIFLATRKSGKQFCRAGECATIFWTEGKGTPQAWPTVKVPPFFKGHPKVTSFESKERAGRTKRWMERNASASSIASTRLRLHSMLIAARTSGED